MPDNLQCTKVRIGEGVGKSAASLFYTDSLSCGDVQAVILELDIQFHIRHPPGRATGS